MIQPTIKGRKLPLNDWEGDDRTPGAGGHYVTCTDTAAGRMVAYVTNGRIVKDGKVYRAALPHPDADGITLAQAALAIYVVSGLTLYIPAGWDSAHVKTHLRAGRGLIVQGAYAAIPRQYRYQANAGFNHAMWVSHISGTSVRVWDPLNPRIHEYGATMPLTVLLDFLATLHNSVAYVPLEAL